MDNADVPAPCRTTTGHVSGDSGVSDIHYHCVQNSVHSLPPRSFSHLLEDNKSRFTLFVSIEPRSPDR
jgi:hypothetical protein